MPRRAVAGFVLPARGAVRAARCSRISASFASISSVLSVLNTSLLLQNPGGVGGNSESGTAVSGAARSAAFISEMVNFLEVFARFMVRCFAAREMCRLRQGYRKPPHSN